MTLTWSDQVQVNDDVECGIETFRVFDGKQNCEIDIATKTATFTNVFQGQENYLGEIKIILSAVQNPNTNQELKPFQIRTYDDSQKKYAVDLLEAYPQLECNYPCFRCGADRDYCYECWADDPLEYLMAYGTKSTCKASCDEGFTTNGDPDLVCIKCDDSCKTCPDNGNVGDAQFCLECADGYDFKDPLTNMCLQECPPGYFATENNECKACSSNCLTCSGTADTCTSCRQDSAVPFLMGTKCLEECPDRHGSSGGVCHACEYPCE